MLLSAEFWIQTCECECWALSAEFCDGYEWWDGWGYEWWVISAVRTIVVLVLVWRRWRRRRNRNRRRKRKRKQTSNDTRLFPLTFTSTLCSLKAGGPTRHLPRLDLAFYTNTHAFTTEPNNINPESGIVYHNHNIHDGTVSHCYWPRQRTRTMYNVHHAWRVTQSMESAEILGMRQFDLTEQK